MPFVDVLAIVPYVAVSAIVPKLWMSAIVPSFSLQVLEASPYRGGSAEILNL